MFKKYFYLSPCFHHERSGSVAVGAACGHYPGENNVARKGQRCQAERLQ